MHTISFLCIHLAQSSTPTCSNVEHGRFCSMEFSPEVMKIIDDQLVVGTANEILVFHHGLQNVQGIDLTSDARSMAICRTDQLSNNLNDCDNNYIRVIEPLPGSENKLMVCGTHSYAPKCTLHQRDLLSNHSTLVKNNGGYSPYSNTDPIVSILADNGRFFSATGFDLYPQGSILGMSPDPLGGKTNFTVMSPRSNTMWLNRPDFVSVYEYGDYVYFFILEWANEVSDDQMVKYARAVRICKSDDGFSVESGNTMSMHNFLTFQKARMECTYNGDSGSISLPFHYNNLQSTYKGESINGEPVLYGVFNSHSNGPPGGAICKFSFSGSLTTVFGDGQYRDLNDNNIWIKKTAVNFSCPNSGGVQRQVEEAMELQLVYNSVMPVQDSPLLISAGEFLDRIVAETIMYKGDVQEIVYYTNLKGDVKQVITRSQTSYKHIIYQGDATSSSKRIRELILRKKENERNLYASTSEGILSIVRGECSNYATCFSCFDSRDAYCAWDTVMESCLNKLSHANLSTLIQSFSASEENITKECGTRPVVPTPVTPPPSLCTSKPSSTENIDQATTVESDGKDEVDCSTSGPVTGGPGNSQPIGNTSISIIAGVTVGALIIGVLIGCLVGIIFQKCFMSRPIASKSKSNPEAPKSSDGTTDAGGDIIAMTPPNNSNDLLSSKEIEKKKAIEMTEGSVNSRYIQHVPSGSMIPPSVGFKSSTLGPPVSLNYTTAPAQVVNETVYNTTTATGYPACKHTNNSKEMNHNHYHSPEAEDNDSAFAEGDTVSPLRVFSSTTPVYHGSLGRHKKRDSNGISRTQVPNFKLPKGRTDSTTWLRQESVSSDISPLQSPISDV